MKADSTSAAANNLTLNSASQVRGPSIWDDHSIGGSRSGNLGVGAYNPSTSDFVAAAAITTAGLIFNRNRNGQVDNKSGVMTLMGGTIPMPDGQRRTPEAFLASLKPKEQKKALANKPFTFRARGPDGKMHNYKATWGSMDGHNPSLFFEKKGMGWKKKLGIAAAVVGVAAVIVASAGTATPAVAGAVSGGAAGGGAAAGGAAAAAAGGAAAGSGTAAATAAGVASKVATVYKTYQTAQAGVNAFRGLRDGNYAAAFFNAAGAFAGGTNLGAAGSNIANVANNVNMGTQVAFGANAALRRRDATGFASMALTGVALGIGSNDNIDPTVVDNVNRTAQVARGVDATYKGLQYNDPRMMWFGWDQVRRGTQPPSVFHFPVDSANTTSTPPFRAGTFQTING